MHCGLVLASILLAATTSVAINCPEKTALAPCTCDGEGVNCRKAKDENAIQQGLRARAPEDIIRTIYIQGTPIKRLQAGIFGRYQFGQFHIDANQITVVEAGVFKGSSATVSLISMYRNKIQSFPFKDIEGLPYLEQLMLSRNELTSIPGPSAFGNHKTLLNLYLGSNKISRIERGAFSGLSSLNILDLSGNNLVTLESQAFAMVNYNPYLEIALSNNSMISLASDAFGQTIPAVVYLDFNRLTSIPEKPFRNMMLNSRSGQTNLVVSGNPFSCRGCAQYRWVVTNKYYLENLLHGFSCADGRSLHSMTSWTIGC